MAVRVKIMTVPFSPTQEVFQDEVLSSFLENKHIRSIHPQFFQHAGCSYWTVFMEYELVFSEAETRPVTNNLDNEHQPLFRKLRAWRKEKADKSGTPVFILATNEQLSQIATRRPTTLEALRQIQGFGAKKVEQHGQELIGLVKAFSEKSPSTDTPDTSKQDTTPPKEKKEPDAGEVS